jgi:LacI family transcriptional regulator
MKTPTKTDPSRSPSLHGHAEREIPSVSIFVETATSWGRRIVAGILAYAKEQGPWHIQVEPRGPYEDQSLPPDWRGDGVIARVGNRRFAEQLASLEVPVVNVSSIQIPGFDCPRVTTSTDSSGRMAVDHFTVRGFRNFGYIGNLDRSYILDQHDSFLRALAKRGLQCSACSDSESPEKILRWLRELPKPVGVLCWGPRVGRLVIDICLSAGISVPHDVAVLGADYDELQSEASYPPQSGIRIASEQIGLIAAGILDQMMAGKQPEKSDWTVNASGVVAKLSSDTLAVADPQVASVMRFIQTNFRKPIGMREILEAVPMSRRSLERKFRQAFGLSVIDRIRQIRVNEVRLKLAGTNDPIMQLAEECGFSSYKYMGQVFQADTGMTPSEYRSQFRPKKM